MYLTQTEIILNILLSGETITPREAMLDYEIYRLAAIIFTLREKLKIPIDTIMVSSIGSGWETRYALYRIPPSLLPKQQERFGF